MLTCPLTQHRFLMSLVCSSTDKIVLLKFKHNSKVNTTQTGWHRAVEAAWLISLKKSTRLAVSSTRPNSFFISYFRCLQEALAGNMHHKPPRRDLLLQPAVLVTATGHPENVLCRLQTAQAVAADTYAWRSQTSLLALLMSWHSWVCEVHHWLGQVNRFGFIFGAVRQGRPNASPLLFPSIHTRRR